MATDDSSGRGSVSAVIFAGGRATRLGGANKALLSVGGRRIIDRVLEAVGPLGGEWLALTNDDALASIPGLRLVQDPEPHAGVLAALGTGLAAARGDVCLAVACDMPFASRRLFEHLLRLQRAEAADVVIPRTADSLEPMHAVYRRIPALAAIRRAHERGERRMISYFPWVRVREVPAVEWQGLSAWPPPFFNVNTPEDLAEAQRLATGAKGGPAQA